MGMEDRSDELGGGLAREELANSLLEGRPEGLLYGEEEGEIRAAVGGFWCLWEGPGGEGGGDGVEVHESVVLDAEVVGCDVVDVRCEVGGVEGDQARSSGAMP